MNFSTRICSCSCFSGKKKKKKRDKNVKILKPHRTGSENVLVLEQAGCSDIANCLLNKGNNEACEKYIFFLY